MKIQFPGGRERQRQPRRRRRWWRRRRWRRRTCYTVGFAADRCRLQGRSIRQRQRLLLSELCRGGIMERRGWPGRPSAAAAAAAAAAAGRAPGGSPGTRRSMGTRHAPVQCHGCVKYSTATLINGTVLGSWWKCLLEMWRGTNVWANRGSGKIIYCLRGDS